MRANALSSHFVFDCHRRHDTAAPVRSVQAANPRFDFDDREVRDRASRSMKRGAVLWSATRRTRTAHALLP
jgi:hypothetical protein